MCGVEMVKKDCGHVAKAGDREVVSRLNETYSSALGRLAVEQDYGCNMRSR